MHRNVVLSIKLYYKLMHIFSVQEMDIKKNVELKSLAVEFRILAEDLVDILDGKIPVITRLKVIYCNIVALMVQMLLLLAVTYLSLSWTPPKPILTL